MIVVFHHGSFLISLSPAVIGWSVLVVFPGYNGVLITNVETRNMNVFNAKVLILV